MELAVQAWWWIQTLPWEMIIVSLGGSAVVATVTQWIKKRLSNKTKTKVLSIVGVLAAIPDILGQIVSNPSWAQYLPDNFAWVFSGAVVLHALLTTPPVRKLQTTLRQYKKALELVQESGSIQAKPIDNPNLTLNAPEVKKPEEKPLVISG